MSKRVNNNFIYMFAALLVFLVVLPLLEDIDAIADSQVQPIGISCLLAIGVWSLRESKLAFRVGMTLVIFAIAANVLSWRAESELTYLLALGPFAGFLTLAIGSALRQVVYAQEMTLNRLIGVVCVYLLLGILWAALYAAVFRTDPSAFAGLPSEQKADLGVTWIYYSFVTLTTLGYGDILPLSVTAKVLAFSEAILGVFYMATLVAMLVSGYLEEAKKTQ